MKRWSQLGQTAYFSGGTGLSTRSVHWSLGQDTQTRGCAGPRLTLKTNGLTKNWVLNATEAVFLGPERHLGYMCTRRITEETGTYCVSVRSKKGTGMTG